MKTLFKGFSGGLLLLCLLVLPGRSAEEFLMFGLTHRPLGSAKVEMESGNLVVRQDYDDYQGIEMGEFGVSIDLGEADSGLYGYLDLAGSLQNEENYIRGHVYGQLNGESDQLLCVLGAYTVDWNGRYEIEVDFSPIGAATLTYLVYEGTELVATVEHVDPTEDSLYIDTYSEFAPWANPFWKRSDGSIAAVIQLSYARSILLPGGDEEEAWLQGDRIVIVAENVTEIVDFASRIDVTAGGGEDMIVITQERLGVLNHGHKALGDAVLDAHNGQLTVLPQDPEDLSEAMGVAIGLDHVGQFGMRLQPQDLQGDGAALIASAVGSYNRQGGEFLGYAGVRNQGGVLQAFGDFSLLADSLYLVVYRNECQAGMVVAPALNAVVNVSGFPSVVGFSGKAHSGFSGPGLSVQLDQTAAFVLPGGSVVEGDQIRFQAAAGRLELDRLIAFSLTSSNLPGFTIVEESGLGVVSAGEYLADVTAPGLLKKFSETVDGVAATFIRSSAASWKGGRKQVVLTDRYSETNLVTAEYGIQEEGLFYRGYSRSPLALSSLEGMRMLPEEITVGQTYVGMGSFTWHDAASGSDYPVEIKCTTSVAGFEMIRLPGGSVSALRLDTETVFAHSAAPQAPILRLTTNWLAAGIGVVQYSESDVMEGGAVSCRAGELTDYAVVRTPTRSAVANVGANVAIHLDMESSPSAVIEEWRRDGVPLEGSASSALLLYHLREFHAGNYSVVIRLASGDETEATMVCEAARLAVIPFSDTPPYWATRFGSSGSLEVIDSATDNAGNVFLSGTFRSTLVFGGTNLSSAGNSDLFLAKLDSGGQTRWIQRIGSSASDYSPSLGVDASGNAYVSGQLGGSTTLGSVPINPVARAIFIAKLDPSGDCRWAVHVGGTATQTAVGVAVDPSGTHYLLGKFRNGTVTVGGIQLTNPVYRDDLFLAKLNAEGQFLWVRHIPGFYVYPNRIVLAGSEGLYLMGSFYEELALGDDLLRNPNGPAGFLARTDANGEFLWAKVVGTDVRHGAVDSQGNLCFNGEFEGQICLGDFWLGSQNANSVGSFLAKTTLQGEMLWARNSDYPAQYDSLPLAVDRADNLYVAGTVYGQATLRGTTFTAPGKNSTVLTKLTGCGRPLWYKHLPGSDNNWPRTLAHDNLGSVFLTGSFQNQIALGETNLFSVASWNAFTVKITGATAPTIIEQPASSTVHSGDTVTFDVAAEGTAPLFYQWRKNGADIAGANEASYTIDHSEWNDQGTYSVVVNNAGGVAHSHGVALNILVPEAGTIMLGSPSYILAETNALLLVNVLRTGSTELVGTVDFKTADGTARAGQDFTDTMVSLQFAPGETLKTVAVPILNDLVYEPTENFFLRLCRPGPGVLVCPLDAATVTIMDDDPMGLPVIRGQPASHYVGIGRTTRLLVTASGVPPLLYQWQKDGQDIVGATNRIYTIQDAQLGDAGVYAVTVWNEAGSIRSLDATLEVYPLPVILAQPQSQVVAYGEPVSLSVVATSCFPVVTQVFQRAYSGPVRDNLVLGYGGSGTLFIHYDFGSDEDCLEVFTLDDYMEETWLLGALTTNGAGLFAVDYGSAPGTALVISAYSPDEGSGDGWTYWVEKANSPLSYRWRRDGQTIYGASGPTYSINFVQYCDEGDYTVEVSDLAGSVISDVAVLTVTGPQLRIDFALETEGIDPLMPGEEPPGFRLRWSVTDYHLEMCEDLSGDEWWDVPNAYSGMILPVSESRGFFRLHQNPRPD